MTKTQLIQHFADKFELTKAGAKAIIEEFSEVAVAQTKKVGEFTIPGIGKLVKQRQWCLAPSIGYPEEKRGNHAEREEVYSRLNPNGYFDLGLPSR